MDAEKGDSVMYKHWELHHAGKKTEFKFNILGVFNTPLERQVAEGVRISRTGATSLLNSKAVYSRSLLPRLRIDKNPVEENLGDVDKTMKEDDNVFEEQEEQGKILTGSMLEKAVTRQKKKAKMRDTIGWGDWEVESQERDGERKEDWEELLGFLVDYCGKMEEEFWAGGRS